MYRDRDTFCPLLTFPLIMLILSYQELSEREGIMGRQWLYEEVQPGDEVAVDWALCRTDDIQFFVNGQRRRVMSSTKIRIGGKEVVPTRASCLTHLRHDSTFTVVALPTKRK